MDTTMKSFIINIVFFLLVLDVNIIMAQNNNDSHDIRNYKVKENRNKLIPKYIKAQYAGSMGLASAGIGWCYGKNEQWETELMVGYIPKYTTDVAKICITIKENFIPWKVQIKQSDFLFEPLSSGFYINSVLNDDFWVMNSGQSSSPYYLFSTKVRLNIFLGQRITYEIPVSKRNYVKSISAFYEISTNDLYLISAIGNSHIKPTDYLHLSLGIRIQRL